MRRRILSIRAPPRASHSLSTRQKRGNSRVRRGLLTSERLNLNAHAVMKNTKMLDIVRRLKMVRIPSPYFCTEPDRVERRAPRVTIPRNGKVWFLVSRFGDGLRARKNVVFVFVFVVSCSSSVSLSKDEGYTMHGGHPRHHVGNTPPSLFAATCAIVVVRGDTKRRGDVSSRSRVATLFFAAFPGSPTHHEGNRGVPLTPLRRTRRGNPCGSG